MGSRNLDEVVKRFDETRVNDSEIGLLIRANSMT